MTWTGTAYAPRKRGAVGSIFSGLPGLSIAGLYPRYAAKRDMSHIPAPEKGGLSREEIVDLFRTELRGRTRRLSDCLSESEGREKQMADRIRSALYPTKEL